MSTSMVGGATADLDKSVSHGISMPSSACILVGVVLVVCLAVVAFANIYLQNTSLGLALSFGGVLVGYESIYLIRKLTKSRSTD